MGLALAGDRAELTWLHTQHLSFDLLAHKTSQQRDSPCIASVLDVENLSRVKTMLQGN